MLKQWAMQVSVPRFPTTGCPVTVFLYHRLSTLGDGGWAINIWGSLQKKICHPGLGTLPRSGPNSSLPIRCSMSGSCFFLPNLLCSHSLFPQCSAILPLPTLSCKMSSLSFPTSSQDDPNLSQPSVRLWHHQGPAALSTSLRCASLRIPAATSLGPQDHSVSFDLSSGATSISVLPLPTPVSLPFLLPLSPVRILE